MIYQDELLNLDYSLEGQRQLMSTLNDECESVEVALEGVHNPDELKDALGSGSFGKFLPWPLNDPREARPRIMALPQFLCLSGENFVTSAYCFILGRGPEDEERESALDVLLKEKLSRELFLAQLCQSPQAVTQSNNIIGLQSALRNDKLERFPLVGSVVRAFDALRVLPRFTQIMTVRNREVAESVERQRELERRLILHYNKSILNFKSEVMRGLKDDFE